MRLIRALKRWIGGGPWARPASLPPVALEKLLRQVEGTQEVEYSCDDAHHLLDQFAEAVLRGDDVARLMPLVQMHLEMCQDCREEFEALLRILKASVA